MKKYKLLRLRWFKVLVIAFFLLLLGAPNVFAVETSYTPKENINRNLTASTINGNVGFLNFVGDKITSVWDSLTGTISNVFESLFSINKIAPELSPTSSNPPITSIPPPVVTTPTPPIPTSVEIIPVPQQIIQSGLTGQMGPRGLTGLQGPRGEAGRDGNIVDTSSFVSRTFLDKQVNGIFDSISNSTQGLSSQLSEEVITKLLTVSGDATIGGNITITGNITGHVAGTINPSFTLGSIPFQGATGLAEDNANLFWDKANSRLGIGTMSPTQKLDVAGNININTNGTSALFSTYKGANADGYNIWIGGGGQSSLGAVGVTYQGSFNTAIGYRALYSNTTGYYNTANGGYALNSNTTGYYNTANGVSALRSNTEGTSNTANGGYALRFNTTGSSNTANGMQALFSNTTGSSNTANGVSALRFNTTGTYNTANGSAALYDNTTGYLNTANGVNALTYNIGGIYNTADGADALYSNTTGNENTANGYFSLYSNVGGNYNTAIGSQAGYNGSPLLQTMTNSTFLGYGANSSVDGVTNSMALGNGAQVTKSNQIMIGNASVTETLLRGNVGIGTTTPTAVLHLKAGTATANTAPLKLTSGINLTTTEAGAIEYDGLHLYFTAINAGTRYQLDQSSPITIVNSSNLFSTGLTGTGAGVTTATYSNLFGVNAGSGATSASNSNFFGQSAGKNAVGASSSNFLGANAGSGATVAADSNFFGANAGRNATSAWNSNFLGASAGSGATFANNSNFLGYMAGYLATSANFSNFIGDYAGNVATDATYSNFIGDNAGSGATSASESNFIGDNAGSGATDASFSNFIGSGAGTDATSASNSIFIGQSAGASDIVDNTTNGLSSILLGSFTNTDGFSNSILLGSGISGAPISNTKDNQFMLAPTVTEIQLSGIDYTLPSAQGGASTFLTNDGSGGLTWATPFSLISTFQPTSTVGYNLFIGGGGQSSVYDGSNSFSGSHNTSVGMNALYSNTTGRNNTANGMNALYSNTTGSNNTANGVGALFYNTTGNYNIANGTNALYSNTTGNDNIANGVFALASNTTGNDNIANGMNALTSNTTGSYNTANGVGALFFNKTGNYNTANGYNALFNNTGNNNTANGMYSLNNNNTGNNNTANGMYSLNNNTTGSNNVALGYFAGYYETGSNAFYVNNINQIYTAGDKAYSLLYGQFSGTAGSLTGQQLTVNGTLNVNGNISATTVNGLLVNQGTNSIITNIALGVGALDAANSGGGYNIAIGWNALTSNTTGSSNIANGAYALTSNISGYNNTANGYDSLRSNTTGNANTANGYYSLRSNDTGSYNTANGMNALYANDTGSYNTANGMNALYANAIGNNNVAFGYSAGRYELGSNAFYINNIAQVNTAGDKAYSLLYGQFSGTAGLLTGQQLTVNGTLKVNGTIRQSGCIVAGTLSANTSGDIICTSSSIRFKNTRTNLTDGLSTLVQLQPVSYIFNDNMNLGKEVHYGFISEEVNSVNQALATHDSLGVPYGLDSTAILAVTVNAIKEMNLKVNDLSSLDTTSATSLGSLITSFLADVGNGVTSIYASVFNAKEKICVDGECLTKEDVKALLLLAHPPLGNDTPSVETSICTSPQILVDNICTNPTLEPEPELIPTPEPTPVPEPTPTPEPAPDPDPVTTL